MMSKLKGIIAKKFASKGQIVILESSIKKYNHESSGGSQQLQAKHRKH
jgi:hypothetical protein